MLLTVILKHYPALLQGCPSFPGLCIQLLDQVEKKLYRTKDVERLYVAYKIWVQEDTFWLL